jgi:hypothetical protein
MKVKERNAQFEMKKSLILTVQEVLELPQPLSMKLQQEGEEATHSIVQGTGEAVSSEQAVVVEFYYSGELLGAVRIQLTGIEGAESKWVSVGASAELRVWKDLGEDTGTGPRVLISIEPSRPLSPIIEQPEPSDCSLISSLSHSSSPTLSNNPSMPEFLSEPPLRLKELQLRVIELEQTLSRERWSGRAEMEQAEGRFRAEMGKMGIVLDKMKAAVKKEAMQCEELKSLLSAAESRAQTADLSNKENLRLLNSSQAQISALQANISALESQNREKDSEKLVLMEELRREKERKAELERELGALKEAFRAEKDEKRAAAEQETLQTLRQTISSLQSALSVSSSELGSHKAKSKAYEATIHDLQVSISMLDQTSPQITSDVVEDLVQSYSKTHSLPVPIVKLSDGHYSIGTKKVAFCVKEGGLAIKVGGGLMALEEFLKMYGPVSQSLIHKPRLLSQESFRRASRDSASPQPLQLPRKSIQLPAHFRTDSEPSDTFSAPHTDRSHILKPRNSREISPRPVWRETVSSHNKSAPKPGKSPEDRKKSHGQL